MDHKVRLPGVSLDHLCEPKEALVIPKPVNCALWEGKNRLALEPRQAQVPVLISAGMKGQRIDIDDAPSVRTATKNPQHASATAATC